jgi:hypothetical protein
MAADDPVPGTGPGPGVDRYGRDVYDPSKNVDSLVNTAIQRQDDLRTAESRHLRELASIRAEYDRILRDNERGLADLRSTYDEKLALKETQRLDAIRAVDVATGTTAAQAAEARAATLAASQQASAEVLRNQLEQARITTAEALEARIAPLVKAVEDLRQAQYQQQGEKSSKVDTSASNRDDLAIEQSRIQAAQARMQMYALVIAAIVLALGLYGAFHK